MLARADYSVTTAITVSAAILVAVLAAVMIGGRPLVETIRQKHREWRATLHDRLLMDTPAWMITMLSALAMAVLGFLGYAVTRSLIGVGLFAVAGMTIPSVLLRRMARKRMERLEGQLVGGIQTISSGVRAGLNLVQSMQLLARDGPSPIRQEFAHMVHEYEYGVPLEQAMDKAAGRIGSGDFRLLFSALHTHRERGGDLGATLDRIGESIREIQRLEKRVQTLTAQGRATARWLSVMPAVVLLILYVIDPKGVTMLFTEPWGVVILLVIVALNVIGYLLIRWIMSVDL